MIWFMLTFMICTGLSASSGKAGIPKVRYSVKPLDLSRTPSPEELMAAGQLGGQLYPSININGDAKDKARAKRTGDINLSFGKAIQEWNRHEYKKAVRMFRKHVQDYPESAWTDEALLHIGCDARYNGRYSEAEEMFRTIMERNRGSGHYGARMLKNKARSRLAILKVLQGNFDEANGLFGELKRESPDWRHRTYASHWIQRISRYISGELALLNCGSLSLAHLLKKDGRESEAREVSEVIPSAPMGHTIHDLKALAQKYGYAFEGLQLSVRDLQSIPLPAIIQVNARNRGDRGHYWVLEEAGRSGLLLYDPQSNRRFRQSAEEFSREWEGNALILSSHEELPGTPLSEQEMSRTYGACCGVQRYLSNLGNPKENAGKGINKGCQISPMGAPVWQVNMINMNMYMTDIPLWYDPPAGPPVRIQLSYNSQSSITYNEPFGNKWMFNYGTFITEDTGGGGGNVTVYMPDGRMDVYTPDNSGGYERPYRVFNDLTKVAENHFTLTFPDGTVYEYNIPSETDSLQPFLTEIRDAYGQKLTFGYNSSTLMMETITDAQNRVTNLIDTNGDGLVDLVDDPFGRSAAFLYDAEHNLKRITDMGGYWTAFEYDQDVYLRTIRNDRGTWDVYIEPADGVVAYANDYPPPGDSMWQNYRITITNPFNDKEEFFYHAGLGDITGVEREYYSWYVSPRDYVTYENGLVNTLRNSPKIKYLHKKVVSAGMDNGEIEKIIQPEGGYVEYRDFDLDAGRPQTVNEFHGHGVIHTRHYTYNSKGRPASYTDPKGNVYSYTHYPNDIDVQNIKLDMAGTPENDDITLYAFTYFGDTHDVATITDRLGTVTGFSWDNTYGHLTSINHARGSDVEMTTDLLYDGASRELLEVKRDGTTIASFTYDDIGRVETVTDAAGLEIKYHEYSDLDQPTKITFPDTVFDAGNPVSHYIDITYSLCCPRMIESITDRGGITTSFIYDALKRLTDVQGPDGTTKFDYDANGNLTKLVDADNKGTWFEYNLDNRLVKKTYADGNFETYGYDLAGLLIHFTNSRNIEKTISYDARHNVVSVTYSDNTPPVSLGYDDYGRLDFMTDGTGTYDYGYDDSGRLTTLDGPWTDDAISFTYNALGQVKTMNTEGGQEVAYTYDYEYESFGDIGLGRLKTIQAGANTFTYNYIGINPLMQSLTRPNESTTEYLYNDQLMRLTEIANKDSAGTIINKHIFTYNNLDVIARETVETGTPMTHIPESMTACAYNAVNQLLSCSDSNRSYMYDADGNMTQGYTPDGYEFAASYDAENRLASIEFQDSNGIFQKTEYYYRGDGMLAVLKKYAGGSIIDTIRFVRTGHLPVQERDGSNAVRKEYTWGLNMGGGIGGLLNLNQGGEDYFYLYDGRGNVMALADSEQRIAVSYRYDAFGVLKVKTGSLDQPFMFSTKPYDESTGLSYYGYRFYNPSIGRWMTRDPLGEAGGINLYGFVGNSPANRIDPLGLWGSDVHSGIGNDKYGTYLWAREIGIPERWARRIARGNNATDNGPWTNWLPLLGDQSRHFNQPYLYGDIKLDTREYWANVELSRALKYAREGNCEAAYGHLGKGLHSLQDKYAHRDHDSGYFGINAHPMWFDDWNDPRNAGAASATESATKEYLLRFYESMR